ncbi:DDB1- and CUL4-associated factor 13 [Diplonema papillatum]|nr:DDB1- and CUL4-associated factor 13 [Diplonema papillatum]
MKIKCLSRASRDHTKDRGSDVSRVHRNLDPKLHPFDRQIEYKRAVTAAKLDRMFAKPFVAAFDGHIDTVCALAKDPSSLSHVVSGGFDGEVRLWNIQKREMCHKVVAHRGAVSGLVVAPDGSAYLSCSADKAVRLWDMDGNNQVDAHGEARPLAEYLGDRPFSSIDHHWVKSMFVTAGSNLELWDVSRQRPISTFNWGIDQVTKCRFNKSEPDLILCAMSDRSVCIYDSRIEQAAQKVVLNRKTNAVCWNPMEPMTFICANEDHNIYQFDARKLDKAQLVYVSHVGPVLDVDFAPTGKELVSGSFDRTVRLWKADICNGSSRDVYHTKRMRNVWSVLWSLDNTYVLSGSDDMNVRLWKSQASAPLKQLYLREKKKLEYAEKLRERFGEFDEVKRINKQRLVPKHVKSAQRKKRTMAKAARRRLQNQQGNTKRILEPPTLKQDVIVEVAK